MVDRDVFEITDFTTASEWERFVAGLEEVLHEWRLNSLKRGRPLSKGALNTGKWKVSSQEVNFADFRFKVERHWLRCQEPLEDATLLNTDNVNTAEVDDGIPEALQDMMSLGNDFCCRNTHCLTQWYGLRDFLLIMPAVGSETISNESRTKLLLSSVSMALNNTGCRIPAFIQLHRRDEQLFVGVCEGGSSGVSTHFQMVHLRRQPQSHYERLAGILDLFKSKLGCPIIRIPPVTVSVCFTYVLADWDHSATWPQPAPDVDFGFLSLGSCGLDKLPFGSYADPIREILVSAIWPQLTEDVAVDNSVHSDLDPVHAPLWNVRVRVADDPACLLGECLTESVLLCDRRESTSELLGGAASSSADSETDPGIAHALDRLAGGILISGVPSSVSTVVSKTRRRLHRQTGGNGDGPIPVSKLKEVLFFLFPDAVGKPCPVLDKDVLEIDIDDDDDENVRIASLKELLAGIKSCPVGSLLHTLSVAVCHVQRVYGGISAVAHLWHEVVLEFRHRWENSILIPGLEPGSPNLSRCLLYQKLQMLNYCIEKKRTREMAPPSTAKGASSPSEEDDDEDDEFYECSSSEGSTRKSPTSDVYVDSLSHAPDGRLRRCNDWTLTESDEPLYIPVTQEPSPMTEDQLEEHAEVLIQLGEDEDGAQLRAQMQSACLLSDMQAFKAANPGCLLDDFVRWYSPRDWIGNEQSEAEIDERLQTKVKRGHLSSRMLIPGNVWLDVWNRSKPIPVRRQKRLFDDTKEGEKVLHTLSSLRPADVVLKLLPQLIHNAIITVYRNRNPLVPFVSTALESVAREVRTLSKSSFSTADQYEEIVEMLSSLEVTLSQAKALQNMFVAADSSAPWPDEFVRSLLNNKFEMELPGGSKTVVGRSLLTLFRKSAELRSGDLKDESSELPIQLPSPERREYLLRCSVRRPAPYSTPTPQRLLCCTTSSGDFRVLGAFSQDTTFF